MSTPTLRPCVVLIAVGMLTLAGCTEGSEVVSPVSYTERDVSGHHAELASQLEGGPCDGGTEVYNILLEYVAYGVSPVPACHEFAPFGGSAHFTWCELNGRCPSSPPHGNPHYDSMTGMWGLIRPSLTSGLERARLYYGDAIMLTSGYRCPHGNQLVGGVGGSLHMQGRAADMYSTSGRYWTEEEFLVLQRAVRESGAVEYTESYWTYADRHLHAAW
jgi:hypothetical protein